MLLPPHPNHVLVIPLESAIYQRVAFPDNTRVGFELLQARFQLGQFETLQLVFFEVMDDGETVRGDFDHLRDDAFEFGLEFDGAIFTAEVEAAVVAPDYDFRAFGVGAELAA